MQAQAPWLFEPSRGVQVMPLSAQLLLLYVRQRLVGRFGLLMLMVT
jgi:hypothetical protein